MCALARCPAHPKERPTSRLDGVSRLAHRPRAPHAAALHLDESVIQPLLRSVRASLLLAVLLPFLIVACTWILGGGGARLRVLAADGGSCRPRDDGRPGHRREPRSTGSGVRERRRGPGEIPRRAARATGSLGHRSLGGLSLFLELAVIRWHGSEWEMFAFYKNFSLLACFLGLGLGYALARAGPKSRRSSRCHCSRSRWPTCWRSAMASRLSGSSVSARRPFSSSSTWA